MWRTLIVMLTARRRLRRRGRLAPTGISRIRLTTLLTDIDLLLHMNNGRYLSLFDLGRWDLLVRTGLWDVMKTRGWYAVVSSETVTFRKSLNLWQRFDVESRMIGHDDKAVYLEHRAVVDGEVYARADHPGAHDEALRRHAVARRAVRRGRAPRGRARSRRVGARVGCGIRSSAHARGGAQHLGLTPAGCSARQRSRAPATSAMAAMMPTLIVVSSSVQKRSGCTVRRGR